MANETVEGEFEVGTGYTRSGRRVGGGAVLVWNPKTQTFEKEEFPVEWEYVSRTKALGKAFVSVPVGTIIKHVRFVRGGTEVSYYIATKNGFKKINYTTVKKEVAKIGEDTIKAKCNVLEELGIEDCFYYDVGPFKTWLPEEPTSDRRKVEMWKEILRDIYSGGGLYDTLVKKVKELTGVEPKKFVYVNSTTACAKFPYLGREKFKELASNYDYEPLLGCFEIPIKKMGSDVAEKIREFIEKRTKIFRRYK